MHLTIRQSLRVPMALALVGTAVAGCGTPAEPGAAPDLHDFAALFEGYSADYEPAETPSDLAARSELVVEGLVTDVTKGRVWGVSADDPGANTSVILNVEVSEPLVGDLPAGAGGMVYVELPSPGNLPASTYAASLPPDTEGVFYLVPASMSAADIMNPQAGRPEGQPVYEATTPQGIILGSDAVTLRIVDFEEFDGSALSEFIPEAKRFPVGSDTTDEPDVPGQ